METAAAERPTVTPARTWVRLAAICVVLIAAIEITLSMWRPETFPRLRALPEPVEKTWNDGCNDHTQYWNQGSLFWTSEEFQTLGLCFDSDT